MTQEQRTQLDRAIERAIKAVLSGKCFFTGQGTITKGLLAGKRFWTIQGETGQYTVILQDKHLVCNCPTQAPAICKHRAMVHLELQQAQAQAQTAVIQQAEQVAAQAEEQEAPKPTSPAFCQLSSKEQQAKRDNALPAWATEEEKPFSIFK